MNSTSNKGRRESLANWKEVGWLLPPDNIAVAVISASFSSYFFLHVLILLHHIKHIYLHSNR